MLMRRLQSEVLMGGYVTGERVRLAVDNFASRDLLTTVTAEATGMLHEDLQENIESILSSLPAATNVTLEHVTIAVKNANLSSTLASELAEFLFLAGLLGNYDPQTGYVQFCHRRDTYKFRREGPWTLHKGLMYAFNIPYSLSGR